MHSFCVLSCHLNVTLKFFQNCANPLNIQYHIPEQTTSILLKLRLGQLSKLVPYHTSSVAPFYSSLRLLAYIDVLPSYASLFMVALWNRETIYIFMLWFVLSFFFLLFSSPNLSRRGLDVCHTSTHGVALVRI